MSVHLNLKVDEELDAAIRHRAVKEGRPVSAVVRDALRRGLGVSKDSRELGYYEGRTEAYGQVLKAVRHAVASIPAAPRRR